MIIAITILVVLLQQGRGMTSNMLLFFQQRCWSLHVWVDSLFHLLGFILSGFQNETKAVQPSRFQYILCLHIHVFYTYLLFSKAEFWPKALFIVRTASSSRNKIGRYIYIYANHLISGSETIMVFIIASYSFKFFSYLTYASIDHNFSHKKHAYLMRTFYSESCSNKRKQA